MNTNRLFYGLFLVLLLLALTGCDQINKIMSRDLKLKLLVDNAKGIHENTAVYLVQSDSEKLIGKAAKIEESPNGQVMVNLTINSEYKNKIRSGTLFIVKRPLFSLDEPRILADTLPKEVNTPALQGGEVINETSYAKYRVVKAQEKISDTFNEITVQSKHLMDELDKFIHSDSYDQFVDQLDKAGEDIPKLSDEQKKRFEKEILPKFEEKADEAINKFEKNHGKEKTDKIKEEVNNLKTQLRV